MSTGAIVAALLVLLSFAFWRPLRRVRTALGVGHLLATGQAFLVLGYAAGALFFALEDARPLERDLGPVVAFLAGWVGFAAGVRFDLRVLVRVPAQAFALALAPAIAAAVAVGAAGCGFLLLVGVPVVEAAAAAVVLAAA